MNIIQSFNGTMAYIERTIETGCDEAEIARISGYSYPLFSRIFSILVGYPLNEYLRFRKLSRAAADLRNTDAKIIDIALAYGYESPDSFAAAFKKFHGVSPSAVRNGKEFKSFAPIKLSLTVNGGQTMEVKIEKKGGFTLAGIQVDADRTSDFPKVWGSLFEKASHEELAKLGNGRSFGICSEVKDGKTFTYAAAYDCRDAQKAAKLGLSVMHIPEAEYAVVQLKGSVPNCIHKGWKYVIETFFPEQGYCHAGTPDFEAYSEGDMYSKNYMMELWVPIVKA
ncbi:AraC family transcriptional regulator [Treponema sp. OMZ 906]|uniref:AraC family transcriptional regulator n=1 Tax=Treponema sp. OMZ 906 TaxID=2563662 RepID=UPI0020A3A9FD|nr:AraC family transcriptional regulator [Treponema sp. OMZ 906]UTC55246.1 AraC family transcriptional regulator [Treponema sp. OMZ 906]